MWEWDIRALKSFPEIGGGGMSAIYGWALLNNIKRLCNVLEAIPGSFRFSFIFASLCRSTPASPSLIVILHDSTAGWALIRSECHDFCDFCQFSAGKNWVFLLNQCYDHFSTYISGNNLSQERKYFSRISQRKHFKIITLTPDITIDIRTKVGLPRVANDIASKHPPEVWANYVFSFLSKIGKVWIRVARFFLVQTYQRGEKYAKWLKNNQMPI
jgi:hypothetical protein